MEKIFTHIAHVNGEMIMKINIIPINIYTCHTCEDTGRRKGSRHHGLIDGDEVYYYPCCYECNYWQHLNQSQNEDKYITSKLCKLS